MSDPTAFAAVDLGASSGLVILGTLAGGRFRLAEAARFPNGPTTRPDGLRWDAVGLFEQITRGIDAAQAASGGLTGVGVDTWGVGYGRCDAQGDAVGRRCHRGPGCGDDHQRCQRPDRHPCASARTSAVHRVRHAHPPKPRTVCRRLPRKPNDGADGVQGPM